jgi:hypothetical protein
LRKESHFLECYKVRSAAVDYQPFKVHFFNLVAGWSGLRVLSPFARMESEPARSWLVPNRYYDKAPVIAVFENVLGKPPLPVVRTVKNAD